MTTLDFFVIYGFITVFITVSYCAVIMNNYKFNFGDVLAVFLFWPALALIIGLMHFVKFVERLIR